VISIARRYRSIKLSFDDLVQEGNLGLIRASQDFDPSTHKANFATYATIWIKSYVHRALISNDSLIRVPDHLSLLRTRHRRAIGALGVRDMIGIGAVAVERPSTEQVARGMGISPGELKPSRLAAIERDFVSKTDEEADIVALPDAIIDRRRPEDEVVKQEEKVLLESALRRLNPFEAWVIRERYGLCTVIPGENNWADPRPEPVCPTTVDRTLGFQTDPAGIGRSYFHRTYTELERECGLSSHRIHQVERIALAKLRNVLVARLLQAV
jgi:RNA polymerase primary sigma factor